MRLDIDCIRDILLCVEENTDTRHAVCLVNTDRCRKMQEQGWPGKPPEIPKYQENLLAKYDNEKLVYHLRHCDEAGLIQTDGKFGADKIRVFDLTPEGHNMIDNLRSNTVFGQVCKLAKNLGGASLSVLSQKAAEIALKNL